MSGRGQGARSNTSSRSDRPGTSICHLDTTCGHFRDVPLEGLSFVSGHAIIAWAVATLLWPYLPGRWRWLPFGLAVANAVARVYLGAHNPLDVIGGAGIGVALGALLTMIVGSPVYEAIAFAPSDMPLPPPAGLGAAGRSSVMTVR